jgi:hypothetical protein
MLFGSDGGGGRPEAAGAVRQRNHRDGKAFGFERSTSGEESEFARFCSLKLECESTLDSWGPAFGYLVYSFNVLGDFIPIHDSVLVYFCSSSSSSSI